VIEVALPGHVDLGFEEVAEGFGGEKGRLGSVRDDAALFHEQDAVDLWEDVSDVVGDEQDAGILPGKFLEEFAKIGLRGQVEGI
jgi:hypothetical protein